MSNATDYTSIPALEAQGIVKRFSDGLGRTVSVLNGAGFAAAAGEILAVVGASGSGKSTLLHILGGLDTCDEGRVAIEGREIGRMSDAELGRMRNKSLGFVYQFHHLLPEFTALENVAMPLLIARVAKDEAHRRAREALEALGLSERLEHLPSQLSGGERQRTAIARAMVTSPACILADEPTGNLDSQTALDVFSCLVKTAKARGTAVVIVTHDLAIAARCDRVLELTGGVIKEKNKEPGS